MRRLQDYLSFVAWQAGLSYIALWAVTLWSIDYGPIVFGRSAACHVDSAKVMFYWACDPAHPLAILAVIANTALTVTVWAPVYLAAATVRPEAMAIAVPIVASHVVGLPTAILVIIRLMLMLFGGLRCAARAMTGRSAAPSLPSPTSGGGKGGGGDASAQPATRRPPLPRLPSRVSFGLRDARQR